jgi:hypothetical protein
VKPTPVVQASSVKETPRHKKKGFLARLFK